MENYKQENKSYTLLPNLEITDVNSLDQIFQFCFKSSFYFKSLFLTNQGLHTLVVLYTDVFLQSYECFILLKGNCHFFFFFKVAQSCPTLCHPMDYGVHEILQARILEWGSPSLLQGIFPTQGSNPGLLHCRQILYQLNHQGCLVIVTF